ncbi:hypothetical protein [Planctobacterium marinum]|uniref:hypothetical protein n=1 Tax=Planctobacterium marinum TaxID=1631968 RepID=UPI001E5AE60E|nr:hypothetical protein [Planctobacterium marinum]MCC2604438.1 hypothetical protein [Planctobacterium marinum]
MTKSGKNNAWSICKRYLILFLFVMCFSSYAIAQIRLPINPPIEGDWKNADPEQKSWAIDIYSKRIATIEKVSSLQVKVIEIPFYTKQKQNAVLYSIHENTKPNQRYLFLRNMTNERFYQLGENISDVLPSINKDYRLSLNNSVDVINYVKFYGSLHGTDKGIFYVLDPNSHLEMSDDLYRKYGITSINAIRTNTESWKVSAFMLYARQLFKVTFSVTEQGRVTMLDDTPLQILPESIVANTLTVKGKARLQQNHLSHPEPVEHSDKNNQISESTNVPTLSFATRVKARKLLKQYITSSENIKNIATRASQLNQDNSIQDYMEYCVDVLQSSAEGERCKKNDEKIADYLTQGIQHTQFMTEIFTLVKSAEAVMGTYAKLDENQRLPKIINLLENDVEIEEILTATEDLENLTGSLERLHKALLDVINASECSCSKVSINQ